MTLSSKEGKNSMSIMMQEHLASYQQEHDDRNKKKRIFYISLNGWANNWN